VARIGEIRNRYIIFIGKPEEKRLRRRWEDHTKISLKQTGYEGVE
jgi:hypothetical protein